MRYSVEHFLELFNHGEIDIKDFFGSYENWFNILNKRDLIEEIDFEASESSEWQNIFFIWLYENNLDYLKKIIENIFNDVEFLKDKPFLVIKDKSELSTLFCDDRNNSRKIVESIFGEDSDWWENYYIDRINLYEEVIDVLDSKNLDYLIKKIVEDLKGVKIEPANDFLMEIHEEQNNSEFGIVATEEVISKIINHESSINFILREYLDDISSNLRSIYNNSYNTAITDEIFNDINSELDSFFIGQGEWITVENKYNNNKTTNYFTIEIRDFWKYIITYLDDNKGRDYYGTLNYQGNYISILSEMENCLHIHVPDYPNYRVLVKYINEYFSDYI